MNRRILFGIGGLGLGLGLFLLFSAYMREHSCVFLNLCGWPDWYRAVLERELFFLLLLLALAVTAWVTRRFCRELTISKCSFGSAGVTLAGGVITLCWGVLLATLLIAVSDNAIAFVAGEELFNRSACAAVGCTDSVFCLPGATAE